MKLSKPNFFTNYERFLPRVVALPARHPLIKQNRGPSKSPAVIYSHEHSALMTRPSPSPSSLAARPPPTMSPKSIDLQTNFAVHTEEKLPVKAQLPFRKEYELYLKTTKSHWKIECEIAQLFSRNLERQASIW